MRNLSILTIVGIYLFFGIIYGISQAIAQSPYAHQYDINGNGHIGTLTYNVHGNRITGTLYGNNIVGYQVGRHVVLYREAANQIWTGWISENGSLIGGDFSHGGENSYPWYGTKITASTLSSAVGSTFDANELDTDGWTVDLGKLENFRSDGSYGGIYRGYIGTSAPSEGKTSYYIAPTKFHGDWRGYTRLDIDLFSSGGGYYQDKADIFLTNGNLTAGRFLPNRPPVDWEKFSIPLVDDGGWILGGGATSLNDVLSNVTDFQIRAEYGDGSDKSGLDNVRLVPR